MKNFPIKKALYAILIGSVLATGLIGVTAVIAGELNSVLWKSLLIVLISSIHALAGVGLISILQKEHKSEDLYFPWVVNASFIILMSSYFITVLWVWGIVDSRIAINSYQAFFVVLFAVFHAEVLFQLKGTKSISQTLVYVNTVLIAIVASMLIMLIYSGGDILTELYSRTLAALAIIDTTLTLIILIVNRMLAEKTPVKLDANGQPLPKKQSKDTSIIIIFIVMLFIILRLIFQFGWLVIST